MADSPIGVVIAGGGVAGLEALLALHALAGERVQLTLIAPEDEFVFRPLDARHSFRPAEIQRVPLADLAARAGAAHVASTIAAVDPNGKMVSTADEDSLAYDELIVAVGARADPAVRQAITWDDRSDADVLGGLLRDVEEGYTDRVAVVIPKGPCWPLRGYELALVIKLDAKGMDMDVETILVTPEPSPLSILGSRAADLVSRELAGAGVEVVSDDRAVFESGRLTAVVEESGKRLDVSRVIALPSLRGSPIPGVPADTDGFIPVDGHCRAIGVPDVWAAGDGTAFPLKSGGFASEQADIAAESIAAAAGADVEPHAFDLGARGDLVGLPAGRFLEASLNSEPGRELTMHLPFFGVPVLTYLQRDLEAGSRGDS